jgi:hypothetical protein
MKLKKKKQKKNFCTAKEMVTTLKRKPTEWEKIFASSTSNKGLVTRIHREFKKLNSPKINNPMKKWENEQSRAFPKEEVQMVKNKNKTHEEMCDIRSHKKCKSKPH